MFNSLKCNFNKSYVIGYAVYLSLAFTHYGYFTIQYDIRISLHKDQEIINNFILILECLGCVLGSLLDSLIVRYGKRYRFIIGNTIIFLFSFPLYLSDPHVVILFCGLMYGIGVGLVTSIAPFYMKEVIPASILPLTLVSLQFFLIFGDEIAFLLSYIMSEYDGTHGKLLNLIVFLIPVIIAGMQIILGFTVFKRDTPLRLLEDMLEDECLMELQKLYPDNLTRMAEYDKIRDNLFRIKWQYPSFKELFSERHIKSTIKGFILVGLQNCVGVFIFLVFTLSVFRDVHSFKQKNLILTGIKFMSTFFLFAIIHPKGMKLLLLIGCIGVAITNYGNLILRLIYNDVKDPDFHIIALLNMGTGYAFDGISTCILPIVYACQIMSERGFALSMFLYWFTNGAIMISFFYLIKHFNESDYEIYMYYLAFFCLSATVLAGYVIIKAPIEEEKSLGNEDTSEGNILSN